MKKQLLTCEDARPAARQHKKPCSDCPFSRKALRGWLGGTTADEWIASVHGEALVECHTISNQQCAGAAIYRANNYKVCRRTDALRLPPNTELAFASPQEFLNHHKE
jgi:hypothetical protein